MVSLAPAAAARAASRLELPPLPALVDGVVAHRRVTPFERAFRHRAYQWLVDLDDIPQPPRALRPLAAFRAADHLGSPRRSIRENVEEFLAGHGIALDGGRILMLCNARVLGHVFNPLTVFWCLRADGAPGCVVAEVHNTYGERHAYLLQPDEHGRAEAGKALYVSPFFDVSGRYELHFELGPRRVGTTVVLRRDGQRCFTASFGGRPRPATTRALLALSLRRPLMPLRVSALIRMHGIRLWLRRLPVVPRPRTHDQNGAR
jgi:DUF1365 family protein